MRHRPLFIWPRPDPDLIRWGLRMLMNCTAARYEINKGRMVPLAEYSRDRLRDLRAKAGIAYDERSQGTLQLFRTQKMLDGTGKDVAILQKYGVPYELLDVEGCVRVEPALGLVREKIAGGLRLPGDETGDCFKFTNALAAVCRQQGVEFRNGTRIDGLLTEGGKITGVATDKGTVTGDIYVMALGSYSPLLLRQDRDRPAGLPGQGLLAHHPDHRSCRRPGIDGHGRDPQGGDHPAGRPDPGRRHGRARRLQHEAAASAARHARACRHRPLPQGWRRGQGQLLVRAAADDAGRPAGDRPGALRQPLPQHRPRHAWAGPWPAAPAGCSPT